MSTMNASEIISVLKSEIEDFDKKSGVQETGTVVRVGDGIATVFGMQHAMYGELVEFETGVRGIVQNLETKTIGVVLLGSDYGITEGTTVVRTGKRAGIGVSNQMIGRVVGALGNPIDGGDPITLPLSMKHRAWLPVSRLMCRFRPVFCLLTQCSRLDAASVN